MKISAQVARDIRAFVKSHSPGRHKIEGSTRCGEPHPECADVGIATNVLLFTENSVDLFDFLSWAEVRKIDHRPNHRGRVKLDLYVTEIYGRDDTNLWDVFVATFDASGLVSIHDHSTPRNQWERSNG